LRGLRVVLAQAEGLIIRKLTAGHLELWTTGIERGNLLATEMDTHDLKKVFVLKEVDHYMACNRSVPEGTIQELNRALQSMRADGSTKKIGERYAKPARK
jgi:polar amino acid transport system substrate-binding protein